MSRCGVCALDVLLDDVVKMLRNEYRVGSGVSYGGIYFFFGPGVRLKRRRSSSASTSRSTTLGIAPTPPPPSSQVKPRYCWYQRKVWAGSWLVMVRPAPAVSHESLSAAAPPPSSCVCFLHIVLYFVCYSFSQIHLRKVGPALIYALEKKSSTFLRPAFVCTSKDVQSVQV